jgi:hypothetical protein
MGNGSRVKTGKGDKGFFPTDRGSERWREWAADHNRSSEYDGNSTFVKRSWFGRLLGARLKSRS